MNHKPIWYLGEIEPTMCDEVIAYMDKLNTQEAVMGEKGEFVNNEYRSTTVAFAPSDFWFGETMSAFGAAANEYANWGYELTVAENVQLAQYKKTQHYDWHTDNFPLGMQELDRKVTVVCMLTDPADFEGGELKLRLYKEYTVPMKKGTIVAFPSILEHKVTPVETGRRITAVTWLDGPRFK